MEKFKIPAAYADSVKNVWVEYIQMVADYKPLDLGQGYPDYAAPKHIIEALRDVATSDNISLHQYTTGFGHPRLVSALSKLYSPLIGKEINPQTEILIGNGAHEVLYSTLIGHIDKGDEAIVIEPFFDCYEPMIRAAGGITRYLPLRLYKIAAPISSADWIFDKEELESMFNEKTKMIIVNTPNNPLGKVFTKSELEMIANLCKKWNVLCVSDEVYEWIVYKPNKHIRMASLPGMWDRTITVGSAGKSFSVTGWKVGWAYGPENLLRNLQVVHQNCVYICGTPLQEAIAIGVEKELSRFDQEDCYFVSLARELESKRDYMAKFLRDVGIVPIIPEGGYFMLADWSPLTSSIDLSGENDKHQDYRFTKWMTKNVGLQGIPPTAFYSESHKYLAEHFVRYCFIKEDSNLEKAADILKKWKNNSKR